MLDGLYRYQTHHPESDGKRWFELVRIDEARQPQALPETVLHSELERQIEKSRKDDAATRTARLEKAPRKPPKVQVTSVQNVRNADVIIEVLRGADGVCEGCQQPGPFKRHGTKEFYLEVHHKIRLADGGDDTVENAEGLCPNCHRRRHYG